VQHFNIERYAYYLLEDTLVYLNDKATKFRWLRFQASLECFGMLIGVWLVARLSYVWHQTTFVQWFIDVSQLVIFWPWSREADNALPSSVSGLQCTSTSRNYQVINQNLFFVGSNFSLYCCTYIGNFWVDKHVSESTHWGWRSQSRANQKRYH